MPHAMVAGHAGHGRKKWRRAPVDGQPPFSGLAGSLALE